jgi:hypothetical protein
MTPIAAQSALALSPHLLKLSALQRVFRCSCRVILAPLVHQLPLHRVYHRNFSYCIPTMASRLGTIVTENLDNALVYKTAKHNAIKPEPDLLLAVSENGSNMKVKLDIPAVELHVLKVSHLPTNSLWIHLLVSPTLSSINSIFPSTSIKC